MKRITTAAHSLTTLIKTPHFVGKLVSQSKATVTSETGYYESPH